MTFGMVFRWVLEGGILYLVWLNVHWSVALTLTFHGFWIERKNTQAELLANSAAMLERLWNEASTARSATNWTDDGPLPTMEKQPSEERET